MKKFIISLSIILSVILSACEEQAIENESVDIPMVECFLQPGMAPDTVKISGIIPYADEAQEKTWLEELNVVLICDNTTYALTECSVPGHYIYAGDDLIIEGGKSYTLQFIYNDETISATTTVPVKPTSLISSLATYTMPSMGGGMNADPLELSWDIDDRYYYYISITNIEADPELAMEFMIDDDSTNMPPIESVTTPAQDDFYNVTMQNIFYLGTHQVILYSVTEDYAKLTEQSGSSSISLIDPFTNIENGYGIFSAFACDTIYFEVSK